MKSPMIQNADYIPESDKSNYTDLQVLQSAAGWYVGTMYWDNELKFWDHGSRDTDYLESKEEAEKYLEMLKRVPNPQEYLRTRP